MLKSSAKCCAKEITWKKQFQCSQGNKPSHLLLTLLTPSMLWVSLETRVQEAMSFLCFSGNIPRACGPQFCCSVTGHRGQRCPLKSQVPQQGTENKNMLQKQDPSAWRRWVMHDWNQSPKVATEFGDSWINFPPSQLWMEWQWDYLHCRLAHIDLGREGLKRE